MSLIEEGTLLRAFGSNEEEVEEAREEIIAQKSIPGIEQCVQLSQTNRDDINLEFWLMELAKTWIDLNVSADALIRLFDEVWEPQGRFHEALLYLTRIEEMLSGTRREEVATRVSLSRRAVSGKSAFVIGDGWKSWSAEVGFDSPQKSFDSMVTLWMSLSDEKMALRADRMRANFVMDCSAYLEGFLGSANGIEPEVAHAAYDHFLSIRLGGLKLNPPITDALVAGIRSSTESSV